VLELSTASVCSQLRTPEDRAITILVARISWIPRHNPYLLVSLPTQG
jgi:hypothetical protein